MLMHAVKHLSELRLDHHLGEERVHLQKSRFTRTAVAAAAVLLLAATVVAAAGVVFVAGRRRGGGGKCVLADDKVHERLEDERVVDGVELHVGALVPARLAAARL
jgi:hypothetical protein